MPYCLVKGEIEQNLTNKWNEIKKKIESSSLIYQENVKKASDNCIKKNTESFEENTDCKKSFSSKEVFMSESKSNDRNLDDIKNKNKNKSDNETSPHSEYLRNSLQFLQTPKTSSSLIKDNFKTSVDVNVMVPVPSCKALDEYSSSVPEIYIQPSRMSNDED